MLKPLTLMARVLTILSITIVQAQPSLNSSMLCYISADNTSHKVDAYLDKAELYTITCSYNDVTATIPKFLQFNCSASSSLITIAVHITDGEQNQTIIKDIQINDVRELYELPVLAYVSDKLMQNGKARISSIVFSNNSDTKFLLSELNFSNATSTYEIKLNQIFTTDLATISLKNYFIKSNLDKDIFINIYKSNGTFAQKVPMRLIDGENFIRFDDIHIQEGKYIVVITENVKIKKPNNENITVMK